MRNQSFEHHTDRERGNEMSIPTKFKTVTMAELAAIRWVAQARLDWTIRTVDEFEHSMAAAEIEIAAAVRNGAADPVAASSWADSIVQASRSMRRVLKRWPEELKQGSDQ
jgi:hypothetical protein